jgi:hypothetical protein
MAIVAAANSRNTGVISAEPEPVSVGEDCVSTLATRAALARQINEMPKCVAITSAEVGHLTAAAPMSDCRTSVDAMAGTSSRNDRCWRRMGQVSIVVTRTRMPSIPVTKRWLYSVSDS